MKKYLLIFVLMAFSLTGLNALDVSVEGKAGYFWPTNKVFRRIYDNGGIYGGEIDVSLDCYCLPCFDLWVSVDSFSKRGHSIGCPELDVPRVRTKIDLIPIGFGLRYLYPICDDFIAYVGLGGQYTRLRFKDVSPFLIRNVNKWDFGGIVKLGMLYDFCDGFFVDVFGQYSFLKMDFRKRENSDGDLVYRHHADLSGWTVGAGIGYRFNFL